MLPVNQPCVACRCGDAVSDRVRVLRETPGPRGPSTTTRRFSNRRSGSRWRRLTTVVGVNQLFDGIGIEIDTEVDTRVQ